MWRNKTITNYLCQLCIYFCAVWVISVNFSSAYALPKPTATTSTILQIQVFGLTGAPQKNVLLSLESLRKALPYNIGAQDIATFKNKYPTAITKALAAYGYFQPQFKLKMYKTAQGWSADFYIKPGVATTVSNIDVSLMGEGAHDPAYLDFIDNLPLQSGAVFDAKKYADIKDSLFDFAAERGYLQAKMKKSKVHVNLRTHLAKIIIYFDTGPRYAFGETNFMNESSIRNSLLHRYLLYQYGDPYEHDLVQQMQQNLSSSGYFGQVVVQPLTEEVTRDRKIPITIHLKSRKSQRYSFGVGVDSDVRFRGSFGFGWTPVNSYGHKFNFLAQLSAGKKNVMNEDTDKLETKSTVDHSISATYSIPGFDPVKDTLSFNASGGILNYVAEGKNNFADTKRVGVAYKTYLGPIQQTIALNYIDEDYNIEKLLNDLSIIRARMLVPSVKWSYKTTNKLRVENGASIALALAGSSKNETFFPGLTSSSFFQVTANARYIKTFFDANRLVLRGSYGHVSISDLTTLPLTYQLLAGGVYSIRGYSFNSIGPGRYLAVGSAELQHRVYGEDWYVAGFFDGGNVADNLEKEKLQYGFGPALAWRSVIGTVEASLAYTRGLDRRWHYKVQLSMGPDLG